MGWLSLALTFTNTFPWLGASPEFVASKILESVVKGRKDFMVAAPFSAKLALALKYFAPSILQRLLVKRFEKERKTQ